MNRTSPYPPHEIVEKELAKTILAIENSSDLSIQIRGKTETLYTRNGQPYIGVVIDPSVVYSWFLHLIEHQDFHSSDFSKFLENQPGSAVTEKLFNMLSQAQIRDARFDGKNMTPEYHITLISPPIYSEMLVNGYDESDIAGIFPDDIDFSILGIGFAEGKMLVEQADTNIQEDYIGGSLYIAVEANGYPRDRSGTTFSYDTYGDWKQGLHITIGFKSLQSSDKEVSGDIFFDDGGNQVVKNAPRIVATNHSWRLEAEARSPRVIKHILDDHAGGVPGMNKPTQLGFLDPNMPRIMTDAINNGDPEERIQSIWTLERFRGRALIILTNEVIGYDSLLTLDEIWKIFGIQSPKLGGVLEQTFQMRRRLANEKFLDPNKMSETVQKMNLNRSHPQFRFMERTGFLALTLVLNPNQIKDVPKLSRIIVPGREILVQRDGGKYIWEYPTMYPARGMNPRFPHDKTYQGRNGDAIEFWVPSSIGRTPVFILQESY